ncbi:fruit protein pKIWI502-like [Pyrus x bretschneideri]|uniref:fruit protein pKIWI502-like n=1 Tax=Pyrus x bretschneideri TaxID=225117 RepID=UPI002030350A|nr:fruit protein pKIWI502-like [Pyrus x bretschneideri]
MTLITSPSCSCNVLQDRFKDWESSGVEIVPVLSQPHGGWTGQSGYMCRLLFPEPSKFIILSPHSTAAVLCGQKQMTEDLKRSQAHYKFLSGPCSSKHHSAAKSFIGIALVCLLNTHFITAACCDYA